MLQGEELQPERLPEGGSQGEGQSAPAGGQGAGPQRPMARPTADTLVPNAHRSQRLKTSPDPMSATDRYRLVTPYRPRL